MAYSNANLNPSNLKELKAGLSGWFDHDGAKGAERAVRVKGDTVTVRETFFYKHGRSELDLERKVKSVFAPEARIELVGLRTVEQDWPKDSFWEVSVKIR